MTRYVLVLPLFPLESGAGFSVSTWPLHVTLVGNFATDLPLDEVVALLETDSRALDLEVGDPALFGPRENVRVALVRPSSRLHLLHVELIGRLLAAGATFDDPDYLGDGYRPHVTATRLAEATAGDRLHLSQLALVDMAPWGDAAVRRVVWVSALGG